MRTLSMLFYHHQAPPPREEKAGITVVARRWKFEEALTSQVPVEISSLDVGVDFPLEETTTPMDHAERWLALNGTMVGLCVRGGDDHVHEKPPRCFGQALIRAIDPGPGPGVEGFSVATDTANAATLFLLTPVSPEVLEGLGVDLLVRGRIETPPPLLYQDMNVCSGGPYSELGTSNENLLGSGAKRVRHGMKRRHQA